MAIKRIGKQTVKFENPPVIAGFAAVGGKKEREGPLGQMFDFGSDDAFFGQKSWEKAECVMQQEAFTRALKKARLDRSQLSMLYGGDLLNQCISTGYAARDTGVPFAGLYGACSTMAEGLLLTSMAVDGGFAEHAMAITSSHFCTAERQYRTPLEYGGQRAPTAQWTATAAAAMVLSEKGTGPKITYGTMGRVQDMGVTDVNNMGAAMAPAAYDTLRAFFADTGLAPQAFDLIVTGDLGRVGYGIVKELFEKDNVPLGGNYKDCGILLFDESQDVHAGGSGCGCSAAVLGAYILNEVQNGILKRVLFAGTGAMHSPISCGQGESIPGICHIVVIEA